MTRLIIITLLNIALPFILRFGYLTAVRWHAKKQQQSVPQWSFPWKILLLIGLGLSVLTIGINRLFFFEPSPGFERVIPKADD